eukprot:CAMPEP_0185916418 /NCGR_PEP_ID=MMETSP0924C-20121207/3451_1 /TAXON_ID=321610 /ORGANISM="Perkinsus chesapeaki, Strain ATCC PRA-65" /LENGTH=62 /DNA_ID=CAMNT_0028641521 /DNA_START=9 /DNA_END=193 /DNA_ORIENTATION=+
MRRGLFNLSQDGYGGTMCLMPFGMICAISSLFDLLTFITVLMRTIQYSFTGMPLFASPLSNT